MSFRFKLGLTVFFQVLLSTCLFPQPLVVTAETQDCMQVLSDRCTTPYKQSEDAASNKQEICTALAVYLRCVQGVKKTVKSCISDISYHTISTLIPRQMVNKNCGNVSLLYTNETLSSTNVPAATTPATNRPVINQPACLNFKSEQIIPSTEQITQNPHHSRLCALFGDPHLKTFMNDRQTCVVEGAWPLIENEYFSVQVTNVPLVAGSSATATNTITVLIKAKGNGCVNQKIYRAKAGSLPAEFHDGTQQTGPSDCPAIIHRRRKGAQVQIKIKICYIRTTIIIRQVGEFLTFLVKIPEQILFNSPTTGLCVTGCPYRQRIDYRELLSFTDDQLARMRPRRSSKMTRNEAHAKCTETKIKGFYFDSCLFDLLTTGNVNFSAAAWHALHDSFELDKMLLLRDIQTYNTTEPRIETTPGEPTRRNHRRSASSLNTAHSFTLLWGMLISMFISAR